MESFSGLIFLFLTVCIGYMAAAMKLVDTAAVDVLPQLLGSADIAAACSVLSSKVEGVKA